MLNKRQFISLLLVIYSVSVCSQDVKRSFNIAWEEPKTSSNPVITSKKLLNFEAALYNLEETLLPYYYVSVPLQNTNTSDFSFAITNDKYLPLDKKEIECIGGITGITYELKISNNLSWIRKKPFADFRITPIRKAKDGSFEKLISFDLLVSPKLETYRGIEKRKKSAQNSVLSDGTWYKIGVVKNGIYKLGKSFFLDAGIDVNTINPQSINIYGNGQGLIPFANDQFRHDDLKINRIEFVGEEDGIFNNDDYILFYANGPHKWQYNSLNQEFNHIKHLYSDTSYYFIGINADLPYRIENAIPISESENFVTTKFDDYAFIENDLTNFIKSGRTWVGEEFDFQTTYEFGGSAFTFPNVDNTTQASVNVRVFARTPGSSSTASSFIVSCNNIENSPSIAVDGINPSGYDYANDSFKKYLFYPNVTNNIKLQFNKYNASAIGWLDYIEINVRRNLIGNESQIIFRDIKSVGVGNTTKYKLTNFSNYKVWNVTDPTESKFVLLYDDIDGTKYLKARTDSLQSFIAWNASEFYTPKFFGNIENQNLHALGIAEKVDMVIVTHPLFINQANELADFHRNYAADPLNVLVVTPQQVYNEFSSGMQDITAIKDLMRMLYNRASSEEMQPRYLLLFGDGSYNNRGGIVNNTNFIPTYQTAESTSQTSTLVSDDYYGLLDITESDKDSEKLDVGIGRFTVKTIQEAKDVVKKTIAYMTPKPAPSLDISSCNSVTSTNLGSWRNILTFVGDDGDNGNSFDGNTHSSQANKLADTSTMLHPSYNAEKIIIDSYLQVSTPGGQRYPDVAEAIRRRVENGTLLLTYVGHGGEVGWSSERILDVSTIQNWRNINVLPILLTATCEFSRFDDPGRTSAGELVLLNGLGGGVALCTTTRLAFVSDNNVLTNNYMDLFFEGEQNSKLSLADLLTETKNMSPDGARNFALLGDPALKIAFPKYNVLTESITDTLGLPMDTIKALNVVKLKGFVAGNDNLKLSNFNGLINISVFDKKQNITGLNNDNGAVAPLQFTTYKNVLYKGTAKVINGDFSTVFVVPKDINLNVDSTGRISYYAVSGTEDANGYVNNLKIGDLNSNAPIDEKEPVVELFMNDENFVFGGYTSENPLLYARVFDENGINTSGSGVGHDLISIINEDNSKAIVLNDYYQGEVDSYQKGVINYPFNKLEEGRYSLKLKVWDTHNNSGDAKTEFVVANSEEFALERILNYPNPFTTKTDFYFEHNQCCQYLNVKIDIFTISGKLVKQINTVSATSGYRSDPIAWNGMDDYGDKLARGVYIYKLSLRNNAGITVEKFEKLVILN
jgi:hypothetical protein